MIIPKTTLSQVLKDLKKNKVDVSSFAKDLLKQCDFSKQIEVEYEIKTLREMGVTELITYGEMLKRFKDKLCPPELAPYLVMQAEKEDYYCIFMEPIMDSVGDLDIFGVGRDDDTWWLSGSCGGPDRVWHPDYRFIFKCGASSTLHSESSCSCDFETLTLRVEKLEQFNKKLRGILQ